MEYKTYKPSGKAPVGGVLFFLIAGILFTFTAEIFYVNLMGFVTNIFLRILVIGTYLLSVCLVLLFLVRAARIRRPGLVRGMILAVMLLSWYFGRGIYVNLIQDIWNRGSAEVMANREPLSSLINIWISLFFSPGVVFSALGKILPYGIVSVNGMMIAAIPLLLFWIFELALKLLIPYFVVSYFSMKPYDEKRKMWLTRKEERIVSYVENYRDIRSEMRKGDCTHMLEALDKIQPYKLKGQESYAILEFYKHGNTVGPFVSLTNVKATQSGPRKINHRSIVLCRLLEIGSENAKSLYIRMTDKSLGKDAAGSIKMSERLSRASQTFGSEMRGRRSNVPEYYVPTQTEKFAAGTFNKGATTIHVPRVTPEMERKFIEQSRTDKKS